MNDDTCDGLEYMAAYLYANDENFRKYCDELAKIEAPLIEQRVAVEKRLRENIGKPVQFRRFQPLPKITR